MKLACNLLLGRPCSPGVLSACFLRVSHWGFPIWASCLARELQNLLSSVSLVLRLQAQATHCVLCFCLGAGHPTQILVFA